MGPHASESARIGRYEVLRKIATGGMAELFLAKQVGMEGFEKVVALKQILSHLAFDEEFIAMFRDEARIVAKLNHPNIVQIYDLGKTDDSYFIAMEYIPGRNLSSIAKKSRGRGESMPPVNVARCVAQACEGLFYAHTRKDIDGRDLEIIHRDVSPQNIIVSFSGTVKLVDFGIAKAASKVAHTRAGVLKGKYAYMSPEQIRGEAIDARSDLFAVGIVLYELLCGRRPFEKENSIQTLKAIVQQAPVPCQELNPAIPNELAAIIERCLEKNKNHRFSTAQDIQIALEDFVSGSGERCNNITISNWLSSLFEEELTREKGGTVVFQGVGEVILPDLAASSGSGQSGGRPPIQAPSNRMLEGSERAELIEETPMGADVAPYTPGGYHDDATVHANELNGEARDEASFSDGESLSLSIEMDSGGVSADASDSWDASTIGASDARIDAPFPEVSAWGGMQERWPRSPSETGSGLSDALEGHLDAEAGMAFDNEDAGDATIAMPSLHGDEPGLDEIVRELSQGGSLDLEDATLAMASVSADDVDDDEPEFGGDATIAMPSVIASDDEEDRTLGAEELAALQEHASFAASFEADATRAEDESAEFDAGDATLAAPESALSSSDVFAAETMAGMDTDSGLSLPTSEAPAVSMSSIESESTVRGLGEEPQLPDSALPRTTSFSDDRTIAGVTSDFEDSGLDLPGGGAYDPLPEPEDLFEDPSPTPFRPPPKRSGAELGAIALERREVSFVDDSGSTDHPPEPDFDLDPELGSASPESVASTSGDPRQEYSSLVAPGHLRGPSPAKDVPRAASLSLSQVLSHPSAAQPASGSRIQPLPRASGAARATPSRSSSIIGRQIREVVRSESMPGLLPARDPATPAPAPVRPETFDPPAPGYQPLVPPTPRAQRPSMLRRVLSVVAMMVGVAMLATTTYFVLPFVFPTEPRLTIKTEPVGAFVRINGAKQEGLTPLTISGLSPGVVYRVQLEMDGYMTVANDIKLPPNRPLILQTRLEPMPPE